MNKNIKDILPLTPMQQGMLFHSLLNPETEVYTEQLSCKIIGNLNIKAMQNAWEKVYNKHDALRASFVWEDVKEPLQIIFKNVKLPFEYFDLTDKDKDEQSGLIQGFENEDRKAGFKLTKAPLTKFKLIKTAENEYYFIWSYHHILFDGWSTPIVFKDFLDNYDALTNDKNVQIIPTREYRDFISYLKNRDRNKQKEFWQKYLAGMEAPTKLPYSKFNSNEHGYEKERIIIDDDLSKKIHTFTKEKNITLNTLIQSAWAFILGKYNSENDILFGVTVSGRSADLEGIQNIVGLFINTIPLRINIRNKKNVLSWLNQNQESFAELLQYEYSSLVDIHKWSQIPGTEEMFKSILVVENYPIDESVKKAESKLRIEDLKTIEKTNYPLTLVASPGTTIAFDLAYQTEHFTKDSVVRLLLQIKEVLNEFVTKYEKYLSDILILTEEERTKIKQWSYIEKPFPEFNIIHEWFENIVRNYTDSVAVEYKNNTITYSELNSQSNQLAHHLINEGIEKEDIVGICIDKSFEMVIASLAVLKSGAAFIPLDPSYPEERLNYIANDANIKLLVTIGNNEEIFQNQNIKVINIEKEKEKIETGLKSNPDIKIYESNLAYIIYTSGSTGKPKGVMLQHKGFCNLIEQMHNDFNITEDSSVLQFASYSFDASIAEIFMPLLKRAKLSVIDKELAISPELLVDFMNKSNVTHATLPPSLLSLIDEHKIEKGKTFVSVGDSCSWSIAERFTNNVRLLNGYGPTEASVGSTWDVVNLEDKMYSLTAPIGKPIGNSKIFILDKNLKQVPIGGVGEIFIGGIGLARGYFNRPDLTAERFLPNPFANNPGERIYRTGDTARFLDSGAIEFIGRVDFQVKIRGFRIELGEIESQLNSFDEIKNSVVIASKDSNGNERLIGYIISDNKNIDTDEIKNKLRSNLPDYMIPYAIIQLDEFPLTPNGKVNRTVLPKAEEVTTNITDELPTNANEEIIANIWKDILKINQVSINQNFFEIGGHSLLATQVISRLNESFNIQLPIKYIFEFPTISVLSKEIEKFKTSAKNKLPEIIKVDRNQRIPLSFSQKRLWFLNELKPDDPSYNIINAFKLIGDLNVDFFIQSINLVIDKHEILRTVFKNEHGEPYQKILDKIELNIEQNDFSNLSSEDVETKVRNIAIAESHTAFNLSEGPLLKIVLLKLKDSTNILVFTIHHIIADGWSIPILIKDIADNYNSLLKNKEVKQSELKIQFADYAVWQQTFLQSELYKTQLEYWKKELDGIQPLLELPLDKPRPSVQTFNGSKLSFSLEKNLTDSLNKISQQEGVTLYMTMLSAFQFLLAKYSNQNDVVIGTPIAGRNKKEIENLVGFFVNNLVIRTEFDNRLTFRKLLKNVRKKSLNAYSNQDLPFEKLVEELQPARDMSHAPIFQVMFVFQNIPYNSLEISDMELEPLKIETGTTTFDLSLTLSEGKETITGEFEFNTDLFYTSTIEKLVKHYKLILNKLVENVKAKISKIELVTPEEKNKLLKEYNNTESSFNYNTTVNKVFENITEKYPDDIALKYNDIEKAVNQEITYSQLNKRANKLANLLISENIFTEDKVAICLERSLDLTTSIIATLKAGGAFLPVDPDYPDDRIRYMLEDSDSKFIITTENLLSKLNPADDVKVILLDKITLDNQSDENLNLNILPENLAYVIYTSGSTGRPKGTMLTHKGLCNLANVQKKAFGIDNQSKVMQFSSLSFDASVWETVMAMLNGATLQLTTKDVVSSGEELSKLIESEKITTITLPPSVLSVLHYKELPELKTIITAGEPVANELVNKWGSNSNFFNAYGPTETTVCASMFLCNEKTYPKGPPIGKPIDNFRLYVLDRNLNLLPEGIPGELCIGGVGLARGYLHKPDLTADKFIPDPFSNSKGKRLYRTGDLVRYLPDGNIEFIGRIDEQVKVRGFRIELGEIDSQIRKLDNVLDTTVVVRENAAKEKQIIAYMVMRDNENIDIQNIRTSLGKVLPDYMIPAAFVKLDKLPLTPNGKVDKSALPAPTISGLDFGIEYVEPRNEIETKIVEIAKELLSLEKIGVLDNFFMLGGHSLLATQFISHIREAFQVEIPLRQIFETPTIEGIALAINKAIKNKENVKTQPAIKKISRDSMKINRSDIS